MDSPDDSSDAGSAVPDAGPDRNDGGAWPQEVVYRVPRHHAILKAAGALAFVVGGWFFTDTVGTVLTWFAALVLGGYALRDVMAPVRLAADAAGVTVVTGFAGRSRLAWHEVERVRADERRRLGLRSELVEIDAGESLHLFSASELGVPVTDAVVDLQRLRGLASAGVR